MPILRRSTRNITAISSMARKALDLFCGAGGASMGLARAGFDVYGVDAVRQPRYPFWFRQSDWANIDLRNWDFIWASPPCQAHSAATRREHRGKAVDLIAPVRAALEASGALYCIENVPRAPLRPDLILQGDMFPGLRVVRRRHFETNFGILAPGELTSGRGLVKDGLAETVAGGGGAGDIEKWSDCMGIDWPMSRREVVNAVPPAYAEHIGRWAMRAIDVEGPRWRFLTGPGALAPTGPSAPAALRPLSAGPSALLVEPENPSFGPNWPEYADFAGVSSRHPVPHAQVEGGMGDCDRETGASVAASVGAR